MKLQLQEVQTHKAHWQKLSVPRSKSKMHCKRCDKREDRSVSPLRSWPRQGPCPDGPRWTQMKVDVDESQITDFVGKRIGLSPFRYMWMGTKCMLFQAFTQFELYPLWWGRLTPLVLMDRVFVKVARFGEKVFSKFFFSDFLIAIWFALCKKRAFVGQRLLLVGSLFTHETWSVGRTRRMTSVRTAQSVLCEVGPGRGLAQMDQDGPRWR